MSDIEDTAEGLKARAVRTEEPYVAVPVTDLLEVLERLAELEELVKTEPDTLSTLKAGDTVEVLINWGTVYSGTRGTVDSIVSEEYPIKVWLPGQETRTGFRRCELGKVTK